MKIKKCTFETERWGIYITPMIGLSWVGNKKQLWIGWLCWLFTVHFNEKQNHDES